jgi:hypothetical protein
MNQPTPARSSLLGAAGGVKAIDAFGIEVTWIRWDMTSISRYGAYHQADTDLPTPAYGHPKDRRWVPPGGTDLKQIQAGIVVTADGGIPVLHRAYDGGAVEVAKIVDTMGHLRTVAGSRNFLLVGDSKLIDISYTNVTAMTDADVMFIAPLAAARVPDALFAGLDPAVAEFVAYIAERDDDKPCWDRDTYRVREDNMGLPGPRKKDSAYRLRRILVHSTANATAQAKACANKRARARARARTDLDALTRTAGTRCYPPPSKPSPPRPPRSPANAG